MYFLSVILEFFVGWESQMYTASEGTDSIEICMVVMIRTEVSVLTPAVFNYQFISTGEAIGTVLRKSSYNITVTVTTRIIFLPKVLFLHKAVLVKKRDIITPILLSRLDT